MALYSQFHVPDNQVGKQQICMLAANLEANSVLFWRLNFKDLFG